MMLQYKLHLPKLYILTKYVMIYSYVNVYSDIV